MIKTVLRKIFGSQNDRELSRVTPRVAEIAALEPEVAALSDEGLTARSRELKSRLADGASLDDLLPQAFALVRETSRRRIGLRHFDVQMLGGLVLHSGKIAEMKTGEGKTLVATLPLYANALLGKGCHLVTVNDYLAKRDAQWMGPIYASLGLSVGVIQHEQAFLFDPTYVSDDWRLERLRPVTRREAYAADLTYGTNNEFGFDYLRDNMVLDLGQCVQRELHYAIVDEVDSILIDEARTPLIISGPAEESTELYYSINRIIPRLQREKDFTVDEKQHTVALTEEGVAHVEELLGIENLYDPSQIETLHHVTQGLRAHVLYHRDVDYLVKDGQVIIVDEFTGRLMPGRRWSDGLHQAVEAKEAVRIENENQTLATITFQNYFRMYKKLGGMTGTADTEAAEFKKIYNLDVVIAPTHLPMIRDDLADMVYKTEGEKFKAVIEEIAELHATGRPVLVGTISIEKSERLATLLGRKGIEHQVLNAKHHEKEAHIIAQAGRPGAVTLATNMAGRGVDILLGGNPDLLARNAEREEMTPEEKAALRDRIRSECAADHQKVIDLGGLHIIGTERHEARRVDNQLRGRAGRQGDPGSSRFYLSLEDDLMRIFGSDRLKGLMERLGMEEDVPIEHSLVTRAIENAQKRVEAHNFEIRKHLLEYDDVMNRQREVVYAQRRRILSGEHLKGDTLEMIEEVASEAVAAHANEDVHPEDWDWPGLEEAIFERFNLHVAIPTEERAGLNVPLLDDRVREEARRRYGEREVQYGETLVRYLEKMTALQVIDGMWKDHLLSMDHLKEGIGLRGYGQRDPLKEYQREAFDLFMEMVSGMKKEIVARLFRVEIAREAPLPALPARRAPVLLGRGPAAAGAPSPEGGRRGAPPAEEKPQTIRRSGDKVGRNDLCPCGSGKKYKKCHGR